MVLLFNSHHKYVGSGSVFENSLRFVFIILRKTPPIRRRYHFRSNAFALWLTCFAYFFAISPIQFRQNTLKLLINISRFLILEQEQGTSGRFSSGRFDWKRLPANNGRHRSCLYTVQGWLFLSPSVVQRDHAGSQSHNTSTNSTASLANLPIVRHSLSRINCGLTIQEPPHATICGIAR